MVRVTHFIQKDDSAVIRKSISAEKNLIWVAWGDVGLIRWCRSRWTVRWLQWPEQRIEHCRPSRPCFERKCDYIRLALDLHKRSNHIICEKKSEYERYTLFTHKPFNVWTELRYLLKVFIDRCTRSCECHKTSSWREVSMTTKSARCIMILRGSVGIQSARWVSRIYCSEFRMLSLRTMQLFSRKIHDCLISYDDQAIEVFSWEPIWHWNVNQHERW
jgi:hypothetical protein